MEYIDDSDVEDSLTRTGRALKPKASSTYRLSPFVSKIILMLLADDVAPFMSWNNAGDCVQIKDMNTFAAEVRARSPG